MGAHNQDRKLIAYSACACSALKYDEAAVAACLTPTKAVEQLMSTITHLTIKNSGQFLNPDGNPITF